jgi:hypothetical protein
MSDKPDKAVIEVFTKILDKLTKIEQDIAELTDFFSETITSIYPEQPEPQQPDLKEEKPSQYIT